MADAGNQARAALTIGVVIIFGLSVLSSHHGVHTMRPALSADAPTAEATVGASGSSVGRARGAVRTNARAARRAGRRFLTAFLGYEANPHRRGSLAALRATADADLAKTLFASPPREVRGATRESARVVSLRAGDDVLGDGLPLLATVERGHRATELVLVMQRKDAHWLVTRLGG